MEQRETLVAYRNPEIAYMLKMCRQQGPKKEEAGGMLHLRSIVRMGPG